MRWSTSLRRPGLGCQGLRRRDERGTSLTEVLVAGTLGIVVAAATVGVFTATVKTLRTVTVRTSETADSRIAMNEIGRELRVAVPLRGGVAAFTSATATQLTFYSLLDRTGATAAADADVAPTQVSYSFSSSCLWVTYTPMVLNAGSTAWLTSTPVSTPKCLLHTTTAPQFSYFTTGAITAGGQLSAPLTSVQWIAVRSIEVTIVADDPNDGGVSASQLRSRISLSNVLNGVTA